MTNMSPSEFRDYVAQHVADYQRTGGEIGAVFNGIPCVVLTTRGAKSGEERHSPIVRVPVTDSDDYVAVASMGGAPKSPSWCFNLRANPDDVTLQDGPVVRRYRATEVAGPERGELWEMAVAVYPEYAEYQTRTDRVIPVFRLEPTDDV